MIPVEKNKTYEIKIAALGSNGEGIGRIEGYTGHCPERPAVC